MFLCAEMQLKKQIPTISRWDFVEDCI